MSVCVCVCVCLLHVVGYGPGVCCAALLGLLAGPAPSLASRGAFVVVWRRRLRPCVVRVDGGHDFVSVSLSLSLCVCVCVSGEALVVVVVVGPRASQSPNTKLRNEEAQRP